MSNNRANQNSETQTDSKNNQSEPKKLKPAGTKPRKRKLIVYEWCFWLLFGLGGIMFFVNHKFAIASIPVIFVGLIFGAFALRLSLINNGSTHLIATIWWWIVAVPSFLICGILFWVEISPFNDETPPPLPTTAEAKTSDNVGIKNELDEIRKAVLANTNSVADTTNLFNKRYPGYSLHFILRLKDPIIGQTNFIWDVGHIETNRLSVYIDPQKNLCFRVIDEDANPFVVKAKSSFETFLFNNMMYLFCEYGSTSNFSFARIVINGKQVAEKYQDAPIKMSEVFTKDTPKAFGKDLKQQNGGNLTLYFYMAFNVTMDKPESITAAFDNLTELIPNN